MQARIIPELMTLKRSKAMEEYFFCLAKIVGSSLKLEPLQHKTSGVDYSVSHEIAVCCG
jgi:hypothetical protein